MTENYRVNGIDHGITSTDGPPIFSRTKQYLRKRKTIEATIVKSYAIV